MKRMNPFAEYDRRMRSERISINSPEMLDIYRLYKSIELCMLGRYDYVKYKTLKNLSEESFAKESGDLRLAVQSLTNSHEDRLESIKRVLLVSVNNLFSEGTRADCARKAIYTPEKLKCYGYIFNGEEDHGLEVLQTILFEREEIIQQKFEDLVKWLRSSKTVNEDFFRLNTSVDY